MSRSHTKPMPQADLYDKHNLAFKLHYNNGEFFTEDITYKHIPK